MTKKNMLGKGMLLILTFPGTAFCQVNDLGKLNGGLFSEAVEVSGDGAVVVGGANDGAAGNAQRAFRWTQRGGMVSLGTLNGGTFSVANGVNGDGSIVAGSSFDGAAGNNRARFAGHRPAAW